MVMALNKHYPDFQMDENRTKPGSNSNAADKRVAEPSRAEFFDKNILYSMFE